MSSNSIQNSRAWQNKAKQISFLGKLRGKIVMENMRGGRFGIESAFLPIHDRFSAFLWVQACIIGEAQFI
jgi:hypothetical protein